MFSGSTTWYESEPAALVFPDEFGASFPEQSTVSYSILQRDPINTFTGGIREFGLYRLGGYSDFQDYVRIALLSRHSTISVLQLTDAQPTRVGDWSDYPSWNRESWPSQVLIREDYPSWQKSDSWQKARFFVDRKFPPGTYQCNSIRDDVLDAVARPENISGLSCDSWDSSSNSLVFDSNFDGFVFSMTLTQEVQESENKLVSALERIQNFVFHNLNLYLNGHVSFIDILSINADETSGYDLDVNWGSDFGDPFADDDPRTISRAEDWVCPDLIRVQVKKLQVDPSFGIPTDASAEYFELVESRTNWLNTNFEEIDPLAYLARLKSQASVGEIE
jgi:hypothetical protein